MKLNTKPPPVVAIALVMVFVLVIARWGMNGFDFTSFFNAGSDFVDGTKTPSPVVVQPGQGYDGQFFYRLALDPFNYSQVNYGVTFDFPSYRAQRIIYPMLAWLFSFGGIPQLVPLALVIVNILSFSGIFYFIQKITSWFKSNPILAYYPLLIFGCYMSIAKDLSEVTELFFFTGTIWFMLTSAWWRYCLFASLTLLTRETSLVVLAPITAMLIFKNREGNKLMLAYFIFPFVLFLLWKMFVNANTQTSQVIEGTGNISIPFTGIYPGFIKNFDFSSTKNIMQFCFWISYFAWQLWIATLVIITIIENFKSRIRYFNTLGLAFLTWMIFALCLSPSIYIDDWSFVRVFALWNMTGMLIVIAANKPINKWFLFFSFGLLILTFIRLIIKI